MTVAYVTDHAVIERTLVNWLEPFAGPVLWINQPTGRPELPYATLQYIADGLLEGRDAEFHQYNEGNKRFDVVVHGPRRMTIQCMAYAQIESGAGQVNARYILKAAIAAIRTPSVLEVFQDAGLAFYQQLSSIQTADEMAGQRWERRAQVDLEFGYTSLVTDKSESTLVGGIPTIDSDSGVDLTVENEFGT